MSMIFFAAVKRRKKAKSNNKPRKSKLLLTDGVEIPVINPESEQEVLVGMWCFCETVNLLIKFYTVF